MPIADALSDATLKIKRADKHVKKADVLAHNYIQTRPFELFLEHDANAAQKLARLRFVRDIPDALAEEAHIAIHGFRSALDSLAWAVANRGGAPASPKAVTFPIAETEVLFKSASFQGPINKLGSDWATFVAAQKPYPGGNNDLVTLHKFDIADKHRYLTRIGQMSMPSLLGASFSHSMSFNVAALGFALEEGMMLVTVGENDPDPHVQLTLQVGFCEIEGTIGKPLTPTLKSFSQMCTTIVNDAARALFPSLIAAHSAALAVLWQANSCQIR
jgi:hypothetical protein